MKKVVSVLLVGLLVLCSFCGCQKKDDRDLLDIIKERGKMTIAVEGTWEPYTFKIDDELVGYDVEVARAIAEKLGVEAEFVEVEWDGLLAGVQSGRYDIAANGIDYSKERAETFNMSKLYAYSYVVLTVRKDDTSINCFEDLKGKTTANTLQSTYAILAESYGANVTGVDDFIQTIELLLDKRIDGTLNSDGTVYYYMKANPDANVRIADITDVPNEIVAITKKSEKTVSLINAINDAIDQLREEGKLTEISMKYFGKDVTVK